MSQLHEEGFQERWYGARIYVPSDWVFESESGGEIVLQWHAVLGTEWKTRNFPPLSIATKYDRWQISRAFGPKDKIQRGHKILEGVVERGKWTSWVVHARWSSGDEGKIEVWRDGALAWSVSGPNTYLSKPRTPYFKTGIYHPEWRKENADAFEKQNSVLVERIIYTADIKMGESGATYRDVAPKP